MKSLLTGIAIGAISLLFVIFVLFTFLYPIISGIHYWVYVAPNIKREIDAPWSYGKNWCGMKIYKEKVPLKDIPSDCLYLMN